MLARALARSIKADFRRVQCTPDLLPSDVTGVSIYNPKDLSFEFRRGPIFAHVVLADEINRATPRTQSAFLEAMEERQVSIDGATHPLPAPFFLIATQNPIELAGTFPLPEAQLDRFLLRVSLGYPDDATERRVMAAQRASHPIAELAPVADLSQLGASPRGALALMRASQALALVRGERYVAPDHVKLLAPLVLAHRIVVKPRSRVQGMDGHRIVEDVVQRVEVPIGSAP
jgi:MoxR-like ATPase